ncbi:MAG TPA: hypothetical protein VFO16_04280, partial [Pseudonocardiaceae bacterium]|nr:hypothetical protein [Pseudonocardiaceae bacterium]
MRPRRPKIDVGGDGESIDPGPLHGLYSGSVDEMVRDIEHKRYAQLSAGIYGSHDAGGASWADQEYNIRSSFGGQYHLVASPVGGHHLGDNDKTGETLLDVPDRHYTYALDKRVADLDELRTCLRRSFGDRNRLIEIPCVKGDLDGVALTQAPEGFAACPDILAPGARRVEIRRFFASQPVRRFFSVTNQPGQYFRR